MAVQDPKQDPKPASKPSTGKLTLTPEQVSEMDKVFKNAFSQVMQHEKDIVHFENAGVVIKNARQQVLEHEQRQREALITAMDSARDQEMHEEKLRGERIKNDNQRQKSELDLAKAVQDGVALPANDPPPPEVPKQGAVAPMPEAIKELHRRRLEMLNQQSTDAAARAERLDGMIDEIVLASRAMDEEKSLSRSPAGGVGRVLGSILNLGSGLVTFGNFNLGTEIFGGTMSQGEKAQRLATMVNRVSPLVRSELNYELGRERNELTAAQRIARAGYNPGLAAFAGGSKAEDASMVIGTIIDMPKGLQGIPEVESTGLLDMFSMYENMQEFAGGLTVAGDAAELDAFAQQYMQTESGLREAVQTYIASGGNKETLQATIEKVQTTLDEKYQADLQFLPGDTQGSVSFRAMQKAVANEMAEKYGAFAATAMQLMDEEKAGGFREARGVGAGLVAQHQANELGGLNIKKGFTGRNFTELELASLGGIMKNRGPIDRIEKSLTKRLVQFKSANKKEDMEKLRQFLKRSALLSTFKPEEKSAAVDRAFAAADKAIQAKIKADQARDRARKGFGPK